jgi:hypothetical protein
MAQSKLVDVLGLFHTDREVPSALFPVRVQTDMSSFQRRLGAVIAGNFISRADEGAPAQRPSYRVEAVYPPKLAEIALGFGITATSPDAILEMLSMDGHVSVHEVNDVGYE